MEAREHGRPLESLNGGIEPGCRIRHDGMICIFVGVDARTGRAILVGPRAAGLEVRRVEERDLTPDKVESLPRYTLRTWMSLLPDRGRSFDTSQWGDLWDKEMDMVEFGRLTEGVKRRDGLPNPGVPVGHYGGEVVVYDSQEYYYVDDDGRGRGRLVRLNKAGDGAEIVTVPYTQIKSRGSKRSQEPPAPRPEPKLPPARPQHRPDPNAVRYSMQMPERLGVGGREWYRAGDRIDRRMIQHHPSTEILVVDFERDSGLLQLYNQMMASYESMDPRDRLELPLPKFINRYVRDRLVGDIDLVNGLCDGTVSTKISTSSGSPDGIDPRIDRRVLASMSNKPLRNTKIYVGWYVAARFGACRQMGTIAAACLERAIDQGRAAGWRGVEIRANEDAKATKGHMFPVALSVGGSEMVFDPAHDYYGPPKDGGWGYEAGYKKHKFGRPGT